MPDAFLNKAEESSGENTGQIHGSTYEYFQGQLICVTGVCSFHKYLSIYSVLVTILSVSDVVVHVKYKGL